ncbi:hypothetical protein [Candidatus Hodarchaeum mangrovi]
MKVKMRRSSLDTTTRALGRLKSLIVISDWINFADNNFKGKWNYKTQDVVFIDTTSVILVPVDFTRILKNGESFILLYGAGIYWTRFSVIKRAITTDSRFITGLLIPEKQWLDCHFNTEPFIFPPMHNFIINDFLQEFPFNALRPKEDDIDGARRRAFGRGLILAQLVFPLKESLMLLKKATERYENFDAPDSPMRILISEFTSEIKNEIIIEKPQSDYQVMIPGIRNIKSNLLEIFPEKWKTEIYLRGLRRDIAHIAKDFAFIGAPLILRS